MSATWWARHFVRERESKNTAPYIIYIGVEVGGSRSRPLASGVTPDGLVRHFAVRFSHRPCRPPLMSGPPPITTA